MGTMRVTKDVKGESEWRSAMKAREEEEMVALANEPFYHGVFPRDNAEHVLHTNGEFLLRFNDKEKGRGFVLSLKWVGSIRHFKINAHHHHVSYFIRKDKCFPSIKELIHAHWRQGLPMTEKEGKDGLIRLDKPAPRDRWELRLSDVALLERIGQGAFGEVHKALYQPHRSNHKTKVPESRGTGVSTPKEEVEVAVKLCKEKSQEGKAKFAHEALFQLKFKHKNIVQTIGVVLRQEPMMIVLEFMSKGSLLSYLRAGKDRLSKPRLKAFCVDAARGMEYLEKLHCIHRDLATRNCLVGAHEEVKIADFGLAKCMEKYKMIVGKVAIKWMSPESLRSGDFSTKSDVWSYGILMWEVFAFGAEPYPGLHVNEVKKKILTDRGRMDPPKNTPPVFAKTMSLCWAQVPKTRPSFTDILRAIDKTFVEPDHDRTVDSARA